MTPAEILRAARDKIQRPECWTKFGMARRLDGVLTLGRDPEAVAWCPLSAISAVSELGSERQIANWALREATQSGTIVCWNDAPERTHAEVLAAFDKAIALAEEAWR